MRGIARVCEAAAAGLCWALLVVGLAITVLMTSGYTSTAIRALAISETSGVSRPDTVLLGELVRGYVSDSDSPPLPNTWRGQQAFGEQAASHLRDVRAAIASARWASGACALVLTIWLGYGLGRRRWRALRTGMRAGTGILAGFTVLMGLAGAFDFDAFFTAFHGVFFKAGTWQFAYDELLIRLFPERFWMASGVVLAVLMLGGAAVLAVVSFCPFEARRAPKEREA